MNGIFMEPPNMNDLILVEALPVPCVTSVHHVKPLIVEISEEESIAIMDKKKAHGLLEVMVIQIGNAIKAGIDELSQAEYGVITRLMQMFGMFTTKQHYVDMLNLQGYIPRISFNYDPLTRDRDGLQDIKRFHAHMFLISPEQQFYIEANKCRFTHIHSAYQKRRLVDPFSFIAEQILLDIHRAGTFIIPDAVSLVYISPEEKVTMGQPLGLNLNLTGGWVFLGEEAFNSYLIDVHMAIKQAADEIYIAFTGGKVRDLQDERYLLLDLSTIRSNLDQMSWLSTKSRDALLEIAGRLKPIPDKLMTSCKPHQRLINHHVIANGPAFTISIYSDKSAGEYADNESITMNISVRLFSDIGGAGLFGCRDVSGIYLNRNSGVFSDLQMAQRHSFQENFLKFIEREIGYSTNTWTEECVNQLLDQSI